MTTITVEGMSCGHCEQRVEEAGSNAQTVIYLVRDESEVVAAFALADVIREESRQTIDALHETGIEVAMLTGDSEDVARAVASDLGIDQYFAEVLPDGKDTTVSQLQEEGKLVAMVGDGVNDAPALTRADVGIAVGSGTDVAIESGDIILVDNNPLDVVRLIRLSKASYRKMQENLVWASAIPLETDDIAVRSWRRYGEGITLGNQALPFSVPIERNGSAEYARRIRSAL